MGNYWLLSNYWLLGIGYYMIARLQEAEDLGDPTEIVDLPNLKGINYNDMTAALKLDLQNYQSTSYILLNFPLDSWKPLVMHMVVI